jgi:YHS domain-containing protein
LAILVLIAADRPAPAAENTPLVDEKRLALSGYDPVSYFTAGRPEKGSVEYQAIFDDATYWFKSAEHRTLFLADPDHYAPQFRGYCTGRLSRTGETVEVDPENWAIADGKLYVFGSRRSWTVFQERTADVVEKATENWAKVGKNP